MMMRELDICGRLADITPKEEIVRLTVQDMEVGLKRPTTLPCSMSEKLLWVFG